MGFSVEHDPEVQAYKQLRAQVLAQKREREAAVKANSKAARAKVLRELEARENRERERSLADRIFGRRKAVSVRGNVVDAKKMEEDSEFEVEVEDEDEFEEIDLKVMLKH